MRNQMKLKEALTGSTQVNGYASRIPSIFCLKSQHIGNGRAVLAPAGRTSQITKSGSLGRQELVLPFHVLCARISNKIYLESLRYTRSPCTVTFVVPFNFIRFLISALCGVYVYVCCSNETFSDLVDELFSNKTFI